MGQKKMTREERKRRQRALSNLDIPNFETFWKVKRAENVEGVGEYIWTCLSKIIVHHIYQQLLYNYVFCGNCPDQVKFVRGLSKLVWAKGAHIFKCPCTHNTCIHWAVDHLFQQFTKKKNSDGTDIHSFVDKNNYAENFGCVFDFEMKLTWFNSLWIIQNQPNCFISTKKYR